MQVEKLSGNPKPLDILAKINQIIDNMVVSVNGSGTDENGNINVATIPVGFNYVQYPGESAPADIFGGTWENISSQFAGMFFRCEGGNAAAFGEMQHGGAPNIEGYINSVMHWQNPAYGGALNAGTASAGQNWYESSSYQCCYNHIFSAANSNGYYNANEFRPYNSTIRVWKRIA